MESLLDLTLPAWSITFGFRWECLWKCGSSGESGTSVRWQECACRIFAQWRNPTQAFRICPVPAVIWIVNIGTMGEWWHSGPWDCWLEQRCNLLHTPFVTDRHCTKIALNIDFLFDERCCWVEHLVTSLASTPFAPQAEELLISGYPPGNL